MQFTLKDLFLAQNPKKGEVIQLTLEDYIQRGGIYQALERHAQEVFEEFSQAEHEVARRIFSRLVAVSLGAVDTRRTATYAELLQIVGNQEAAQKVISRLSDNQARLLVISTPITTNEASKPNFESFIASASHTITNQSNIVSKFWQAITIFLDQLVGAWLWLRALIVGNPKRKNSTVTSELDKLSPPFALIPGDDTRANPNLRRTVTIAHDRLIDGWSWLRQLVSENREIIALQNEISDDAQVWMKNQQDPSYLYSGARLAAAAEKLAAGQLTLDAASLAFLQASIHREKQTQAEQTRRKQLLTMMATALLLLAVPALFIGANVVMFYLRQHSPWQLTAFPANPVTVIATNPRRTSTDEPLICVGTADIGVGCSRDAETWNLYQAGLPTGLPSWVDNRNTWWGSLTGNLWSTKIRTIAALSFDAAAPERIVALVDHSGLYARSADTPWHLIAQTAPMTQVQALAVYADRLFILRGTTPYVPQDVRGRLYFNTKEKNWEHIGGVNETQYGLIHDMHLALTADGMPRGLFLAAERGLFQYRLTAQEENSIQRLAPFTTTSETETAILVLSDPQSLYWITTPAEKKATKTLLINVHRGSWGKDSTIEHIQLLYTVAVEQIPFQMTLGPAPDNHCAQPPCKRIWLAFSDSRVAVLEPNGELHNLQGRPTWLPLLYDLHLLPQTTSKPTRYLLLLGHRDGLVHYCPGLNDPFYACIGDVLAASPPLSK